MTRAIGVGARPTSSEQGVRSAARGPRRNPGGSICGSPETARCGRNSSASPPGSGSPAGCAFSAGARMCRALLAAADLLVCPSLHEPLGNVVIEAWSAGLPVVATASDGPAGSDPRRRKRHSGAAPRTVAAAAPRRSPLPIERVCADPALRARLGRAGRRAYEAEFTEPIVVARLPPFLRPGDTLMCGIAGLMTHDGAAPPPAPLQAMGNALRHRGPDGDGRYRSGRCRDGADPARDHRPRDRRSAAL